MLFVRRVHHSWGSPSLFFFLSFTLPLSRTVFLLSFTCVCATGVKEVDFGIPHCGRFNFQEAL